jgi:hypothetical protein
MIRHKLAVAGTREAQRKASDSIVIRFAGESGDGMQLVGLNPAGALPGDPASHLQADVWMRSITWA